MEQLRIYLDSGEMFQASQCFIDKRVNEHFTAVVTGKVSTKKDSLILRGSEEVLLTITFIDDDRKEIPVFKGRIERRYEVEAEGAVYWNIFAVSLTMDLDRQKYIRTFQGEEQNYLQIIGSVLAGYENTTVVLSKEMRETTDGLAVQYMETDWQFLKRLAAKKNQVLVADGSHDNICFHFGRVKRKGRKCFNSDQYRIKCYHDCEKGETVEYLIKSRKCLQLCDCVMVENGAYYIYSMSMNFCGGKVEFDYVLRTRSGFMVPAEEFLNLAGVMIMGKVRNTGENAVQIKLLSEKDETYGNPLWFPLSTIYTSPEGTGLFVSPKQGDPIRLYLPDGWEEHAYAIGCVPVGDASNTYGRAEACNDSAGERKVII